MVESGGTNSADVHAGPLADRLQTLENGDVFGGVVGRCHVYNERLLKGLLLLALCTSIVAAFQGHLAASVAISENVPVPGGRAAVARALGLGVVPERGRFVSELARIVLGTTPGRIVAPQTVLPPLVRDAATETIPVPLTTAIWSESIFRRKVEPFELLFAILSDRRAALLCRALTAFDDETLEYFATHRSLLTRLYERSAAAFGAFGANISVRSGRVATPGGTDASPLWESVVGERVTDPDRFLPALFAHNDGRTAYLYDTVSQLETSRVRFALGLWIDGPGARLDRMKALVAAWSAAFGEWSLKTAPLARNAHDPAMMFLRVRVEASGAPSPPASMAFWSRVFDGTSLPDDAARMLREAPATPLVDAAALIGTLRGNPAERALRLDQVAFGQRVFARASQQELPDALVALRGFPRFQMLALTVERMGVATPAVYAEATRAADRLANADRNRSYTAIAGMQGVLAVMQRMTAVHTIGSDTAERLLRDLAALPLDGEGGYSGRLALWVDQELRRAMPARETLEASLLDALSGPPAADPPVVRWEGLRYHLDVAEGERRRLAAIREHQNAIPLDTALEVARVAQEVTRDTISPAVAESSRARLAAVAASFATADADTTATDLVPQAGIRDPIARATADLARRAANGRNSSTGRIEQSLIVAGDELTAASLASWAYAVDLGDPDGAALLVGDLSRRHDFGFALKDSRQRAQEPWREPRAEAAANALWHVGGSLLGLDLALAPLSLYRIDTGRTVDEPTVSTGERATFAASHALLDALTLDDDARNRIGTAIDAGLVRVSEVGRDPVRFAAVADEIRMDGWRRRAAAWTLEEDTAPIDSLFSLAELLALGAPSAAAGLNAWGMSGRAVSGCLCVELLPASWWTLLAGRTESGMLAAVVPDLNLHVARTLMHADVPAAVAKHVLGAAIQDFIDDVRPTDPDDWLTLVRTARAISRERIEDYVAAAAAGGPLVPLRDARDTRDGDEAAGRLVR
jgi:hypothetical protein